MKYIFLIILLSGCSAETPGWIINLAYEKCIEHEGVDYIDHVNEYISCNDSKLLKIKRENK